MILIADGGSTKVDWVVLDDKFIEIDKVRTEGLNPAVVDEQVLTDRLVSSEGISQISKKVNQIYFYGAGCGTTHAILQLEKVFKSFFSNAQHITIGEDMLGAAYAASPNKESVVCILGTGSNSCFFDGKQCHMQTVSLGYMVMDEASGNYFGKLLLRDFFYSKMPTSIADKLKESFNMDPNEIKKKLYSSPNPNTYLAHFASAMNEFKHEAYIRNLVKKGFETFFEYRVLPFVNEKHYPLFFIGSIAYFFKEILEEVAESYDLSLNGVIRRPIDNLIAYHRNQAHIIQTEE